MRKAVGLLVLGLLVVSVVLVAGCGSATVTVKTDKGEGEVSVTEEGGKATFKTDEGETTVTTEKISEKDVGIPIYPGAKLDKDAAGTVSTKGEKGESKWSAAVLYTKDSVDKVVSWYKEKLAGEPGFKDMSISAAGEQMGMFTFKPAGDEQKTVTVAKGQVDHPNETVISVVSGQGPGVPPSNAVPR